MIDVDMEREGRVNVIDAGTEILCHLNSFAFGLYIMSHVLLASRYPCNHDRVVGVALVSVTQIYSQATKVQLKYVYILNLSNGISRFEQCQN